MDSGNSKMRVNFGVVDNSMTVMDKMKQYITAGMDTAIDVVNDFNDFQIHDFGTMEPILEKAMLEYAEMELNMQQFLEAVQHVKERVHADGYSEDSDLVKMLEEKTAELKERDGEIDLKDHTKFKTLQEKIAAANDQDLERSQEGETSSMKGDIAISQAIATTKCPFSGKEMTNPVKNIHCGHSYDMEGVRQLMSQRKNRAKCPVAGCANTKNITESHLSEDKELKKVIAKEKRQPKKRK